MCRECGMICSSSAPFSVASVIMPARSPCGDSRSVSDTVSFADRGPSPQDLVDPVSGQPPLDRAGGGDPPEHRAATKSCPPQPGLERADRAGLLAAHARQGDVRPLPRLVGFRARDAHDHALGFEPQVGDIDADQLRAPEGAGEADQKQRPVAQAGGESPGQTASSRFTSAEISAAAGRTGRGCARPMPVSVCRIAACPACQAWPRLR